MPSDPQQLWKNQPEQEAIAMNLDEIRRRVEALRKKTKKELTNNVAVTGAVALLAGVGLFRTHDPIQQAGFGLALVWALAGLYFVNRGLWETEAGAMPGVETYRLEIERRRSLFHRSIKWLFGPTVLASAMLGLPGVTAAGINQKAAPFFVLLASWIVAYFYMRSQGIDCLQREIENLNRYSAAGSNKPKE
jgi:hypothetical protein